MPPRQQQPPVSRATPPPSARPRRQPVTTAGRARRAVTAPVSAGNRAGRATKGGQHALMAEFLLFCGIVGLRAVADYVPGDQGQPTEGTSKGAITPRGAQLGPLPVLAAGLVVFFVLSFLAARGGAWARVAAVSGLIIDTALLMKSLPELATVSKSFENVTSSSNSAGSAAGGALPSTYVQPVGYQGTATVPVSDATGIFPVITPNVPPVAQGAGQNPSVFTQP